MASTAAKPASADLTLLITRTFNAPRERVFDAWTDPKQIAKWIGPRTVRPEVKEMSAKAGGRYRIHMRRDDGADGPMVGGQYREIVRPERLVFTWMWESAHPMGHEGHETTITLTFRDIGGKTEMTLRQEIFDSKDSRDSHNQGWTASFDKLAEMLA
jgi:uncharacterized protein YndB with AHSA1/START domain